MSQESMLAIIHAELRHADAATMNAVLETLRRAKQSEPQPIKFTSGFVDVLMPKAKTVSQFIGENLTLEQYERLSLKERAALQTRLKEQNYLWLREHFEKRKAAWLVVVNGRIERWGTRLKERPLARQNVDVAQRTGKFPFVFINDDYMAIEETASRWNETIESGDFYPTIPLALSSASNVLQIVGDFDTGASGTFLDYDFLRTKNLVRPETGDYNEIAMHLGKPYQCVSKLLHVELSSDAGEDYASDLMIDCVPDWHESPSIKINPSRIALVGRDVLLTLKPSILLDFEARATEVLNTKNKTQPRSKTISSRKRNSPQRKRS